MLVRTPPLVSSRLPLMTLLETSSQITTQPLALRRSPIMLTVTATPPLALSRSSTRTLLVGSFPNGVSNNAIGHATLTNLTTGSFNQAIGVNALGSLTDGVSNVAIGDNAMLSTDGSYNTVVGFDSGANLTLAISSENIYLGDSAGTIDNAGNNPGDESGVIRIGSFFSGTVA